MLSTIDRVIMLKSVSLFHEVPDVVLIELASLLEEIDIAAGATVVEQDVDADGMYIVASGQVKIHDGPTVLRYQKRGDAFGELTLLDAQPRRTSITAVEDTRLLKLDQEGFYLMMEDHIEFGRGVIRVLSSYLRGDLRNVTDPEFKRNASPD